MIAARSTSFMSIQPRSRLSARELRDQHAAQPRHALLVQPGRVLALRGAQQP